MRCLGSWVDRRVVSDPVRLRSASRSGYSCVTNPLSSSARDRGAWRQRDVQWRVVAVVQWLKRRLLILLNDRIGLLRSDLSGAGWLLVGIGNAYLAFD